MSLTPGGVMFISGRSIMRIYLVGVIACAVFLLKAPALVASEADELREKGQRAKQEAMELKKLGRVDESERVARKAAELFEAAERMEGQGPRVSEREIDQLHEHLKALLEKERALKEAKASDEDLAAVREDAVKTKKELGRLKAEFQRQVERKERSFAGKPPRDAAVGKLQEMARRAEHMRIAADHLREAGAHDLAGQLMQKADAIENEAREIKRRLAPEREPGFVPAPPEIRGLVDQIEELRREMGRLRGELNDVRRQVKEMEQRGR